MKIVELIRLEDDSEGTFGVLKINKEVFCVTLEPPDRLNKREKSCIPAQQYICNRYKSHAFGKTFIVENVPNRSGILFHAGNTKKDTAGCIILAQHFGKLRGFRAVLNSGKTFEEFMELMKDDQFHLTIKEAY
jgi:hypothetical protein